MENFPFSYAYAYAYAYAYVAGFTLTILMLMSMLMFMLMSQCEPALSVQNHSRCCFHVDYVQCDSCLEIIYDMLKWPCEKNLGLKRCGVANSLS